MRIVGCLLTFHDTDTKIPIVKGKEVYWTRFYAMHCVGDALGCYISSQLISHRHAITLMLFPVVHHSNAVLVLVSIAGCLYAYFSLCLFGHIINTYMAFGSIFGYGFNVPVLMDEPWKSKSLSEYWGKRWNVVIQRILKEYVYTPLRTHLGAGHWLAASMTFFGSALLHVSGDYLLSLHVLYSNISYNNPPTSTPYPSYSYHTNYY